MSLQETPHRLRVLSTEVEMVDGLSNVQGMPFTGVVVSVESSGACRLDSYQQGRTEGRYREDLQPLDQSAIVWGPEESLDVDHLDRVLHDGQLFSGSLLYRSPSPVGAVTKWSMTEYRDGDLTGNWLHWYPDGRLAEYANQSVPDGSGRVVEQQFGWHPDGGLASSFLRIGDQSGSSATAAVVRFDVEGRLGQLHWITPSEVMVRLMPNAREIAEERVFFDPSDFAGLALSDELDLSLVDSESDLLEVLLADSGAVGLKRLSCTLSAAGLERVFASAPVLEYVDHYASKPSPEVIAALQSWRSAATGRVAEHR